MTKTDLMSILNKWENALETLASVLKLEETDVVRDAAIKRFEYNFEFAWKTIKHFADREGVDCNSPRSAVKTAFKLEWIKNDEVWLDMLRDRNQTTHTYEESNAQSVYGHIPAFYTVLKELHQTLRNNL